MPRLTDSLIGLSLVTAACTHYYGLTPWQKTCLRDGCDWSWFAACQTTCVTRLERAHETACYEWRIGDGRCYHWVGVSAEEMARWERLRR